MSEVRIGCMNTCKCWIMMFMCGICAFVCAGAAKCTQFDTCVVKPITSNMILPDTSISALPQTGLTGISLMVTPGEYEPASFVIRSSSDANGVEFAATDLSNGSQVIPSSSIDIRIVKCWYQAEGAGQVVDRLSFNKVMVPELLLKDDKFIDVRTDEVEDYMKLTINGQQTYVCISKKPDVPEPWSPGDPNIYEVSPGIGKDAPIATFPVRDSQTLQPVDLKTGKNKQVWVTFHVPSTATAGTYQGQINITFSGSVVKSVPIELTVLPFTLADPKTHYDISKEFTSSIYVRGILDPTGNGATNNDIKSEAQFRAELKNMIAHGVTKPLIAIPYSMISSNETLFRSILSIMRDEGITGSFYTTFDLVSNQTSFYAIQALKNQVARWTNIAKSYGFTDFYFYGIDEATGSLLTSQRIAWGATHTAGGKLIVAGYKDYYDLVGDLLDISICQGAPDAAYAAKWHSVGHKIWLYAFPQGGIENPAIYRQNYGIYLWKADYDGASTYSYQVAAGGWNDFCGTMRQLSFTYPTVDGVVDTIQWEGYREGIDDIKYATTLALEIQSARASGNSAKVQTADEAAGYLANTDGYGDPDVVRQRIIEYILSMKYGTQISRIGDLIAVVNSASNGSVSVFDSASGSGIKTISDLGSPQWAKFGGDGNLYISRYQESTGSGWDVARVSTNDWSSLIGFETLPNHQAVGIAYWLDGYLYTGRVYGMLYKSNTVGADPIGIAGGLGGDARGVTISPDGILFMCSSGNQCLGRYDIRAASVLPSWPVTGSAQDVAFGPDATGDGISDLYVTYWGQPVIDIYNAVTGAKVKTYDSLANYGYPSSICTAVAFSHDGKTAYFTDWNDGIVFKKIGTNPAAQFVSGLNHPLGIALSDEYLSVRNVSIADAKKLVTGNPVMCNGQIVTAVFGDYFYIEESDRLSGIQVKKQNHGMQAGYVVSVSGIMSTESGVRCIDASNGSVTGSYYGPLAPLFMTNATLGGGNWFYDAELLTGQSGVAGGVGLNTIGLLVKVVGKAIQPISNGSFYINDGSGVRVRAIITGALPQENSFVELMGISLCEPYDGGLQRTILIADLKLLNQ